ncbi:glycosyltransferase family 39 protein [Microseira wollei]|uniref:Glycosyltransferase RgtA/B/C/D-like domain-containing protein n=1 Tax=Microseira wollei NIES-4236 TaxID=2530354 RepID=A0AAV3X6T9_9CYAN|nr:glycosyltransferase family 39 protein [Microseira wollei]GET37848.1 hypothetical protein MiSe_26020 [Microseira wollei NIES-4236]
MKISYHYLGLALVMVVGIGLRFWHLDFKPLWLDEVITALMTLGRNYRDVPLEKLLPIETVRQIFTLNAAATCAEIANNLATQSTHPPLFFCLMHDWLKAGLTIFSVFGDRFGLNPPLEYETLAKDLRSLPALFGVSAIAAIYYLNRIAFSPAAGLTAAAIVAVSPFGVYLSQEARHYTLPVLLITLSLVTLIQIQQDIQKQQLRLSVWIAWLAINSIGFYVHYFFILAYIAQIVTLFGLFYKVDHQLSNILPANLPLIITFSLLPLIFFIPWLPLMLGDVGRPETNWIPQPNNIVPFFQTLVGWILMVIALPVENYPLWIAIPAVILMILFGIWLFLQIFKGLKQLWQTPDTHSSTWTLLCFTACVLLEFFAIVYLMGKDITVVPRYNFVYYPAISALLAASLVIPTDGKMGSIKKFISLPASPCPPVFSLTPSPTFTRLSLVLLVGIISCIFVVYDLAFQKPYNPQEVAKNMNGEPGLPLAVVMGYNDYQDVALGLSFALALDKIRDEKIAGTYLAFYERSPNYLSVLQSLSQMSPPTTSQLNLWLVIPGLKPQDYPPQLPLSGGTNCTIDPTKHYRIGIPYQLYRCQ